MNLVQEIGDLLSFIDDGPVAGPQLGKVGAKQCRIRPVAIERVGVKQLDPHRCCEVFREPRRFPCPAGAQQQESFSRRFQESGKVTSHGEWRPTRGLKTDGKARHPLRRQLGSFYIADVEMEIRIARSISLLPRSSG